MLIVIAGKKRSGSTAQYNLVRLILEQEGEVNCIKRIEDIEEGKINLLKYHRFVKSLFNKAHFVFTTDRPTEEIVESCKAFGIKYEGEKWNTWFKRWGQHPNAYHMDYKDIINAPDFCIMYISHALGIKVEPDEILEKFLAIKPGKEYDPKTMLFPNHRR